MVVGLIATLVGNGFTSCKIVHDFLKNRITTLKKMVKIGGILPLTDFIFLSSTSIYL